jgi:hypothetical protein
VNGTLGWGDQPILLRPPGYPLFIAGVLKATGTPPRVTSAYLERSESVIFAAQCVVLGAAAALLFLYLSRLTRPPIALAGAVAFGTNPYCVVLAGLLHYDVLHMLSMIAACLLLDRALEREPRRGRDLLLAGAAWGVATLVRPMTLLLPPFVWALFWVRTARAWRPATRMAAVLVLGMAITIAPWTARNFAVGGRFVPVNLQTWAVAWAGTVKPLPARPNHYVWYEVWPEMMAVYTRVTGREQYDYMTYVLRNADLEDAFRHEALLNLRRQPGVYLGNAWRSLRTLTLDMSVVLLDVFRYLQGRDVRVDPAWFHAGSPQDFPVPPLGRLFSWWVSGLTALAAGGVIRAARRPDLRLLAPLCVYLCLAVAHAVTHMDLLYYYVKVPFLVVFSFYALDGLGRLGVILALLLTLASGALTAVLLA